MFNQGAIDRGLYRSTSYEKYVSILQKNQSAQDEKFMKPDPSKVVGMRVGSYEKLNERGFIPEETPIVHGDILIGKVTPIQAIEGSSAVYRDNSETYKQQVPGVVDKVYSDIVNNEGYEMKKVKTRSERTPTVGDKYCLGSAAEALTTVGWIPIKDLTKEHKVACLIDDKYLEYVNPIDVYKFKYNGDMYKLRSQFVDFDVTMDHQMYVKLQYNNVFKLISAKDIIGKNVCYKNTIINKNIKSRTINELNINDVTDLPEWVWDLDEKQSYDLLCDIIDANNKNHMMTFYTKHKSLADNIMRLAIHSGLSAVIEITDEYILVHDYYIVRIRKDTNDIQITQENANHTVYKYDGDVYCLEVPSHVFMMRQNGKNVLIGQCSRHGQQTGRCHDYNSWQVLTMEGNVSKLRGTPESSLPNT